MITCRPRYELLDTLRGLTILSMVMYHGTWDLVYLFDMKWDWYDGTGAYVWQQSICWTFILLSGFCWSFSRNHLRRGGLVFGGGVMVSLVTNILMPENRILFGILTCIGSCMLLMIPVEKLAKKIPANLQNTLDTAFSKAFRLVFEKGTGVIEKTYNKDEMKKKYWDARHNCTAFVIGKNAELTRCSDDGEPSGTAGKPILEVLLGAGLTNVAVVVTRYFGGTLLGTGGLVRAYTQGCVIALNAAQVCEMHPTETWMFEVAYPLWDKVQHTLKSLPVRLESTEFTTAVAFEISVKAADSEAVRAELTRVTDGRIEGLLEEESYSPWIEEAMEVEQE